MAPEILGGKYAVYMVPAFGISIAVFGWMIADTLLRARKWRMLAQKLQADKQAKAAKP